VNRSPSLWPGTRVDSVNGPLSLGDVFVRKLGHTWGVFVVAGLLLVAAPRSAWAFALGAHSNNTGNSATASLSAWSSGNGSLVVANVVVKGIGASTAPTPTLPSGFSLATINGQSSGIHNGTNIAIFVYTCVACGTQSSASLSWALGSTLHWSVAVAEYTGVGTTIDSTDSATWGFATGTGTAVSVSTVSDTTPYASNLVIVASGLNNNKTFTISSPLTGDENNKETGAGATTAFAIAHDFATSTVTGGTAFTETAGGSSSDSWAAAVLTFHPTAKYWIGCTGNAFTDALCWSTTSGGASGGGAPASGDSVIFDGGGSTGSNSPVFGTTTTIKGIDIQSGYSGTFSIASGKTLTVTSSLAVGGGTFTAGGTITLTGATLSVTGTSVSAFGTLNGNGSALSPTSLALSGTGVYNTGSGTLSVSGALSMTGGSVSTGGTATISGAATISGGTWTSATSAKTTTFASLALSGTGGVVANAGNLSVTGAMTMAGTSTFTGSSTATVTLGSTLDVGGTSTFDLNGGTTTVASTVTVTGGTYKGGGSSTFNRNTGGADALTVSAGTFDLNGGTLNTSSTSRSGVTVSGGTYKGTTGTTTIGFTLAVSSGTYDANGGSSTVSGAVTLSGGTYNIGSSATGQTMSNGLTISGGTLDGSSSTGVLKMASGKTLSMTSGTIQTSTASTSGPSIQSVSGTYTFSITGGTVNINGLSLANTDLNGMNISSSPTITAISNVNFANVPTTVTAAQFQLQIFVASLTLYTNGNKFNFNPATYTATKNIRLRDSGGTVGDVIVGLQSADDSTNGQGRGDLYDADEDTSPDDGVGDVGNHALALWTFKATDTAGSIAGYPTPAFDWTTFSYYTTYVAFNNYDGMGTGRVFARNSAGTTVSTVDIPSSAGTIVGTPLWDTQGGSHVLYVATSLGSIYRYVDTAGTLALASSPWNSAFSSSTVAAVTSPLITDGTNVYFGGTDNTGAKQIFGVSVAGKALAKNIATSQSAAVTSAPGWAVSSGSTYLFVAASSTPSSIYRVNITSSAIDATCTSASYPVSGGANLFLSTLYAGDDDGKLHAIDALNFTTGAFTDRSGFPYQDLATTGHSTQSNRAIKSAPFIYSGTDSIFFGDHDGHLYKVNSSNGTVASGFPLQVSSSELTTPIYVYQTGIIAVGDTAGNVYYVNQKTTSTGSPAVIYTTTLTGAVSTISYDSSTSQFLVGTSSGQLVYLPRPDDPDAFIE
jgi:hypothetical protein